MFFVFRNWVENDSVVIWFYSDCFCCFDKGNILNRCVERLFWYVLRIWFFWWVVKCFNMRCWCCYSSWSWCEIVDVYIFVFGCYWEYFVKWLDLMMCGWWMKIIRRGNINERWFFKCWVVRRLRVKSCCVGCEVIECYRRLYGSGWWIVWFVDVVWGCSVCKVMMG